MKRLILTLVAASLAGCMSYPETVSEQGASLSSLVVSNAPGRATLSVDGIDYGPARQFSGASSLAVTPGKHVVELFVDGRQVMSRDVFVGQAAQATVAY
ncbi:hypothetical protein [Parvularcula dongshanensis]|uniref:PEGA domain-containing protein n=1 Tax=Parvularcula dongshanensis TaxID=1173995 RepID=A0A840I342_9PROT|nr:hypothetical protein [Parvularcula dongshanensis]MBB4659426.1 hypothetical protein [Parvularcula dongshanensis]